MRLLIVGFLIALLSTANAFWHGSSPLPTGDVVCNVITGVATGVGAGTCMSTPAACDGSTDDTTAINTFKTWATSTWQGSHTGLIELFIPPGSSCTIKTPGQTFFDGIKKLLVYGYGATWAVTSAGGMQYGATPGICHKGLTDVAGCSARIATVAPGATSVTLTAASYAAGYLSRFTVGHYANINGFCLQCAAGAGFSGYPPNPFFMDYVKITNVTDTGTSGIVTFDKPLRYTYKSTWPNFSSGSSGEADAGGPATIYDLGSTWDTEVEYRGLTTSNAVQPMYAVGRQIVWRDITITTAGSGCPTPSQNKSWAVYNVNFLTCSIEDDKIVETATVQNSFVHVMTFQNGGSFETLNIINSTLDNLAGTPKYFYGTNSSFAVFHVGAASFGRTDIVSCTNCNVTNGGFGEVGLVTANLNSSYTMSGDTIILPNSAAGTNQIMGWTAPGTNFCWHGSQVCQAITHILDVTQDATNTYVQLANSYTGASWPPITNGGSISNHVHPAPQFTCTNCTGDLNLISVGGTAGGPLYSYINRTFNGTQIGTQGSSIQGLDVWGATTSFDVNVTANYTFGALLLHIPGVFDNYNVVKPSDLSSVSYANSSYNLATIGDRVLNGTTNAVTCTGTCTGGGAGTMLLPEASAWWTGAYFVAGSADISGNCTSSASAGCPTVTITIQTNQGVVNP